METVEMELKGLMDQVGMMNSLFLPLMELLASLEEMVVMALKEEWVEMEVLSRSSFQKLIWTFFLFSLPSMSEEAKEENLALEELEGKVAEVERMEDLKNSKI